MIYLACPYSHKDPGVRKFRFDQSCKAASMLMRDGIHVFSPISHTHPIALHGGLPLGWDFWEQFDRWYIERCSGLYILMLDGWCDSVGVNAEIKLAYEYNKPISHLELFVPARYTLKPR